MKNIFLLLSLAACSMTQAQAVHFDARRVTTATSLNIKVQVNEEEKPVVYKLYSDISPLAVDTFSNDTSFALGPISVENIYNIAVQFDSITRYYQTYVPGNIGLDNIFERTYFQYPLSAADFLSRLDLLFQYIQADTTAVLPTADYLLSFKLYETGTQQCVVTFGQYCLSVNCNSIQQYLSASVGKEKTLAQDAVWTKLFREIIGSPPLITADKHVDPLSTNAFSEKTDKKAYDLLKCTNSDRFTIYFHAHR